MASPLVSDSIYWVDVEKIKPNPYQPRREFDSMALESLADSIRQYGVLQPLVVTRREIHKDDGGIVTEYELIAGERRLRASKLAGIAQVPVVIRTGEDNNLMKLELAIIENLQREDLNPVDRAKAFQQFIDEFGYKHVEIAKKVGKSREYVSNSIRLLTLPDSIIDALVAGKITEGHARPLMMLRDKPEEQDTLFKEIIFKKLTVRDAEGIARRVAQDKVRKRTRDFDPEIMQMEKELTEQLGTRVHIEPREVGGKITIDFFSDEDLKNLLAFMNTTENRQVKNTLADEMQRFSQESVRQAEGQKVEDEEVIRETAQATVVPPVAVVSEIETTPQQDQAGSFSEIIKEERSVPISTTETEDVSSHTQQNTPETVAVIPEVQHNPYVMPPVPKRPGFVQPKDSSHEIRTIVGQQFQSAAVGTVAFGGLAHSSTEQKNTSLGDVLRNVLKDKPSNMHVAREERNISGSDHAVSHNREMMADMMLKQKHNDVASPQEDRDDMELPDTGIFRDEVNTILGNGGDDLPDTSSDQDFLVDGEDVDFMSAHVMEQTDNVLTPNKHAIDTKETSTDDDIYSVKNFAL